MRPITSSRSYRHLLAGSLLVLAAMSPAAAGPVEPASRVPQPQAVRVMTAGVNVQDVGSAKSGTEAAARRAATAKRDPKLNDDLAAFSRAF